MTVLDDSRWTEPRSPRHVCGFVKGPLDNCCTSGLTEIRDLGWGWPLPLKSSYYKQKGVESQWSEPRAWSLQASVSFTYINGLLREPEHSHPSKVFLRLPECRLGALNLSVFCNPQTRHRFPDIAGWNLLAVELHTPTCTKLTSKYSRNLFQVFGIRGKL